MDDSCHDYSDLGEILQSPLDPYEYKLIQLCRNGVKCLLISTVSKALHKGVKDEVNIDTCVFQCVEDFNTRFFSEDSNAQSAKVARPLFQDAADFKKKKKIQRKKKDQKESDNDDLVLINFLCGSGSLHDPADVQGMSHLVEHGVFLGSTQHPEPEFLETFLQMSGDGMNTAYTHPETTTFILTVRKSDAEEGLSILTDFLKNPIMDEKRIEREVDLLQSEALGRKLTEEGRYLYFLQTVLATPTHPMGNLGVGCKATINRSKLGQRAAHWAKTNFVGRNLILGIKGPLEMEELVRIAAQYGAILSPCNCQEPPRVRLEQKFEGMNPFKLEEWNKVYYMDPYAKNDKFIRLSWLLPRESAHNTKSKPLNLLRFLFGSRVPGSLDGYLKSKGWIWDISTLGHHPYLNNRFCPIFEVTLHMTKKGAAEKGDLIKAVFSYIKMLQSSSSEDLNVVFKTMRQNNVDYFHYRSDLFLEDPSATFNLDDDEFLKQLGANIMNGVAPSEILTSVYLVKHFEEDLFRNCVKALNVDNVNIIIAASEFCAKTAGSTTAESHPLGYTYTKCLINHDFRQAVKNLQTIKEFRLPGENSLVSEKNFCRNEDPQEMFPRGEDVVIVKDDRLLVQYSSSFCEKGLLPSGSYTVRLESPMADDWADPSIVSIIPMMDAWIRCLKYTLDIKLAPIYDSLVTYTITHQNPCLQIQLMGPSSRLPEILTIIVNTCFEHCCPRTFDLMMTAVKLHYEKVLTESEDLLEDLLQCTVKEKHCLFCDKLEYLDETDFTGYELFLAEFKTNLFVKVRVTGCVTKSDVGKVVGCLQGKRYSPWTRFLDDIKQNRTIVWPVGERCLRIKSKNPNEECGIVTNVIQVGVVPPQLEHMVETFQKCLQVKAYQWLRTKNLLGYSVFVTKEVYCGVTGIGICVGGIVGTQFTTDYVNEKIDEFVDWFGRNVIGDKDEFRKLMGDGSDYGEIWTWKHMANFYCIYISPRGDQYRKLSVQLTPTKVDPGSKPRAGKLVREKVAKYKTEIPLSASEVDPDEKPNYTLDYPSNIDHTNGYFVTNLDLFKEAQMCYSREMTKETLEEDYNFFDDDSV